VGGDPAGVNGDIWQLGIPAVRAAGVSVPEVFGEVTLDGRFGVGERDLRHVEPEWSVGRRKVFKVKNRLIFLI
jgi:hypothetical protein